MTTDLTILPHRILSNYDSLKEIRDGGIPWPRFAIVYPVRGCNMRCVYCEYEDANHGHIEKIDFHKLNDTLLTLRDHGLEGVEFCGGGEPTIHEGLVDEICALSAMGLKVGLLTNGTGIWREEVEGLAKALSYIRFSLDASDEETYAEVKGCHKSLFDKTVGIIRAFVAEGKCDVSIKMCVVKANEFDILDFALLGKTLGVTSVQFKLARYADWGYPNYSDPALLYQDIEDAKAMYGVTVMGSADKSKLAGKCILTPLNVVIDTTGEAYLCCYFSRRQERHTIGNVFETPIDELWGSEEHRAAIAGIRPEECNLFDCRFHRYNRVAKEVLESGACAFL
jgi:radical SAM protein with 4Fe4S-binding SPASM domain